MAAETAEDIKTLDKKPDTSRSILGTSGGRGGPNFHRSSSGIYMGLSMDTCKQHEHTQHIYLKNVSKREKERGK